jgi:hypothetical protein
MDTVQLLLIASVGLIFCNFIIISFLLYIVIKLYKNQKDSNKDYADALGGILNYVSKEFEKNYEAHKANQEWLENNIAQLASLNTENSQKIYNSICQTQLYLNRIGEFLGYRPRTNLNE